MGFSDTVEARCAARSAGGPPPPPPGSRSARERERQPRSSPLRPLLFVAAAGAVLLPLASQLGWLDALHEALERRGVRLPWRRRGGSGGGAAAGGSGFRFPKAKPAAAKQPDAASSLPRNKQSNNKKSKARKAGAWLARCRMQPQRCLQGFASRIALGAALRSPDAAAARIALPRWRTLHRRGARRARAQARGAGAGHGERTAWRRGHAAGGRPRQRQLAHGAAEQRAEGRRHPGRRRRQDVHHAQHVRAASCCVHARFACRCRVLSCSLADALVTSLCLRLRCCRGRYKTSEMYARIREERGTI
jgi:hypothetical protein